MPLSVSLNPSDKIDNIFVKSHSIVKIEGFAFKRNLKTQPKYISLF